MALLLRKYQIPSIANVMLGSAFLSPREAIEDTVETVRWAIEQGTDSAVIFPAHVKQWTLLEWLWERGLYSPPSLWSLVEVLARIGSQLASRVSISWYKVYTQESEGGELNSLDDMWYLRSPSTCVVCH